MRGISSVLDGVAVGAEVGRVHRVGIVIIRIGVLDLDDQIARKPGRDPLLVELVSLFLLNAVVAGRCGSGRCSRASGSDRAARCGSRRMSVDEMIVEEHQRIVRLGMLVESLRDQDDRARDTSGGPRTWSAARFECGCGGRISCRLASGIGGISWSSTILIGAPPLAAS